jgi:hypothetical protein
VRDLFERAFEIVVSARRLGGRGLDRAQDLAHPVDHGQERLGDRRREHQRAIAQPGQHALAGVGQPFQPAEPEEPRGPLDRVDGPEHRGQALAVARGALEGDEVAVEPIEPLEALDQKLANDLVVHGP